MKIFYVISLKIIHDKKQTNKKINPCTIVRENAV